MTREEAIEKLEIMRQKVDEETYRALILAIKALEQENEKMSDEEMCDTYTEGYFKGYDDGLERKLEEPCEDAISREAVLNTLDNMDKALDENRTVKEYKALLKECYKELPSVTRQTGMWINDMNDIPICSRCGYIPQFDRAIDDYEYSNYCPSCGARMVESEESEE